VSGRCEKKTMERSAERVVAERGLQKWLERGAAFSALTLRSHALQTTTDRRQTVEQATAYRIVNVSHVRY